MLGYRHINKSLLIILWPNIFDTCIISISNIVYYSLETPDVFFVRLTFRQNYLVINFQYAHIVEVLRATSSCVNMNSSFYAGRIRYYLESIQSSQKPLPENIARALCNN